jgi:hypothetical protein
VCSGLHRSVLVSTCGSVLGFYTGRRVADLSFVEELVLISVRYPLDLKHFLFFSRFAVEGIVSLFKELL